MATIVLILREVGASENILSKTENIDTPNFCHEVKSMSLIKYLTKVGR